MTRGLVDVAPLITHRFPLDDAGLAAGFDTAARAGDTGAIKVMFQLGGGPDAV